MDILIDLFSINKSKLILILESIILNHNSCFLAFLCFEMKNRKSSLISRRCSDQIKFTIVNGEQTPTNDQRNRFHSKHAKETRISRVECNRVTRRFARNLQRNWLPIFVASKALSKNWNFSAMHLCRGCNLTWNFNSIIRCAISSVSNIALAFLL